MPSPSVSAYSATWLTKIPMMPTRANFDGLSRALRRRRIRGLVRADACSPGISLGIFWLLGLGPPGHRTFAFDAASISG